MTEKSKEVQVHKKESKDVELAADRPVFLPGTDIYEKPDALLVLCDMPGVEQQQVDVTLEGDVLTITGPQQQDGPEGYQPVYREYDTGVFRRRFTLTADVDRAGIDAKLSNGILKILLPKAKEAQPRKIAVQAG